MAAVAFAGTLVFKSDKGSSKQVRFTASDVAAAYWVFPDGQSVLQLDAMQNWALIDVIVVTGGTDTSNSEVFVNGLSAGIYVDHKSNLNTANYRQFQQSPLWFKAGSAIRFKQAT